MLTNKEESAVQSIQPIGILDSGVGGLSIFNRIAEELPNEKLIYIADTLHAPYGDKSDKAIIDRVDIIADKLLSLNCKAIVVACNTATVIAIEHLRKRISLPLIGVEPAIKPAVLITKTKNIAVLITQATANNKRFLALVEKHKKNAFVHIQACPGLVELIENNKLNTPVFNSLLNNYLSQIKGKNIDTIVLGCTHYPFFADKIKNVIHKDTKNIHITLVETAQPVTEQLKRQLIKFNLINTSNLNKIDRKPSHQFISSNLTNNLEVLIKSLVREDISLKMTLHSL